METETNTKYHHQSCMKCQAGKINVPQLTSRLRFHKIQTIDAYGMLRIFTEGQVRMSAKRLFIHLHNRSFTEHAHPFHTIIVVNILFQQSKCIISAKTLLSTHKHTNKSFHKQQMPHMPALFIEFMLHTTPLFVHTSLDANPLILCWSSHQHEFLGVRIFIY